MHLERSADKRNGYLKRLHLFDGGIRDGKPHQTQAGKRTLKIAPNNPANGLMLYSIL